jgi:hypothetical protein
MAGIAAKAAPAGLVAYVAGSAAWHDNPDYAWTETPATEAFFVLLSVVVLPYVAWRLLRRLRS